MFPFVLVSKIWCLNVLEMNHSFVLTLVGVIIVLSNIHVVTKDSVP